MDFVLAIGSRLQNLMPAEEFRRWVAPLKWSYDETSQKLSATAPTAFHQKMFLSEYASEVIRQAEALGRPILDLEILPKATDQRPKQPLIISLPARVSPPLPAAAVRASFDPNKCFESFLVHPSNRLAALALGEFARGSKKMPAGTIFLHSSGPWGKSHLLEAAAASLAADRPVLKIGPEDPADEAWTEAEFIVADDVHLLEYRPEVQKRLAQAYDEASAGRLRILAGALTAPVKQMGLNDQLRSRLAGGLVLKIDPPEFELMMELADRLAGQIGFKIDEEIKSIVVREARHDPRRLAGFVESAAFIAANTDMDLTEALQAVMLDKSPGESREKPDINLIIEIVAASFALKPADLTGHSRLRQTAWPRRSAMYLARELTGLTTTDIGKAFGGRDHSTVIHALKKIAEEIKNPAKARIVENIRRAIIIGQKEASVDLDF